MKLTRSRCRIAGCLLALALSCAPIVPAQAQYTMKVDKTEKRGIWQGWGCSMGWWGHAVGGKRYQDLYADLFFSRKTVPYLDQQLPGLGFNIVRYNIGGGGRGDKIGDLEEVVSPQLPWHRDIDGYWLNWNDKDPQAKSWDWTRDAAQRSMLQATLKRGVNHVEMWSNSPMWWMMDSKSSAGGHLQNWNNGDFALYLATVAQHARDEWKIPVTTVEPFNEPAAGWWNYPKNQEGANISREQQSAILPLLRAEMDKRGLQDVKIAASDENSMNAAYDTLKYFNEHDTAKFVDQVNVHAYSGLEPWRDNNWRTKLHDYVGDKTLWMSEVGDNEGGGMKMAQTIFEDINFLRPTAWIYWQALEPASPWGLVNAEFGKGETDKETGKPKWVYTKYYVMAQLSRFLRPGFQVIGSDDHNSIVAYDKDKRQLTIITLNYGNAQPIEYDLTSLKTVGDKGEITVTNTAAILSGDKKNVSTTDDGIYKVFHTAPIEVKNQKIAIEATANTIYSIVVDGVNL